jgi:hypothetical protein
MRRKPQMHMSRENLYLIHTEGELLVKRVKAPSFRTDCQLLGMEPLLPCLETHFNSAKLQLYGVSGDR